MVSGGLEMAKRLGRAFKRDRRGNVAMMWALMGAVLLGLVGMSVDFTRAQMIRSQLQNAADGAALAAARATQGTSMSARTAAAQAYFNSEAGAYGAGATFNLVDIGNNGYRVDVSAPMDVSLARLVSNHPWTIAVSSEAARGGMNLEVAMVLDTTGSMSGQRITDLRNSAGDLVDILLAIPQVPYYTKVGLITWGMGVNAGSYADSARGSITPARSITGASWATGTAHAITGATKANPMVITSANHGLTAGQTIWISGVNGMTQLNAHAYIVGTVVNANSFQLKNTSGTNINGTSGYSTYTSGGTWTRCQVANCEVVVTANGHGMANSAWTYITSVGGMTQINSSGDTAWQIGNVNANSFSLTGSIGPNYTAYTSGGSAYCTTLGCQYYRFTNQSGSIRILPISTCVSERVNANVTTDVAPSTTPVGYNYAASGNPCDTGTGVIPMTTDGSTLHSRINSLVASGSTAGQIGTAWGWYLLSPNWGYLWPAASRGAAYGTPETQKIAVLMTDGAFNSSYCNGVISQSSLSGSGSASDHINCNATNGASATQTIAICNAMKARGIVVYTVGFHIDNDATALSVFHQCATDDSHFYLADDGTTLQHAFQQIGQSISQLRLTH